MFSTIIGGAMLPHAPQFFTMPDTEDNAPRSSRFARVAAEIGAKLRALKPDLWIIFSNDHAEQFFHNTAPPFTIHVGGEATGEFAGPELPLEDPERDQLRTGPPALSPRFRPGFHQHRQDRLRHRHSADASRPYRSGAADLRQRLSAAAADHGAVLCVRPGGRAHRHRIWGSRPSSCRAAACRIFPAPTAMPIRSWTGTSEVLEKLATGNLKSLIGYDEAELDETGNIELRCWACAAGALGERKPDVVSLDPSWHHNYASLGWFAAPAAEERTPRIIPRSSRSWWSSRRRCTRSRMIGQSARNISPTPPLMPTASA